MPLAGLINTHGASVPWDKLAATYAAPDWRVPSHLTAGTPACYPLPLLLALGRTEDTDGSIRVSSLLGDPRREVLKKRFSYFDEPHELLFMAAGSAFHSWMNEHDESPDSERRLFMDVDGSKVTGRPDALTGGELLDYKTTSAYGLNKALQNGLAAEHPDWEWQTRFYALLAAANGIDVRPPFKLFVMARDWRRVYGNKTPEPRLGEFTVWPTADDLGELASRVRAYRDAMEMPEDTLPACADRLAWGKTPQGVPKRCADYCEVSAFCTPFKNGEV